MRLKGTRELDLTAGGLSAPAILGDFTTTPRVLPIAALAVMVGAVGAGLAWALLALIRLSTNIFYYQRFSLAAVEPAGHHLGLWAVLVPVAGALLIGLMARFGSERIRGHGIPEAIEAILLHGSRVNPKVAVLKPLSSAISIGSGGPFGAEGPIIMTGGAVGSLVAQFFHLTAAERKTLLVAGAAAGMSATFATPLAAVMLAVELLLFEWKPRSLIPVALASVVAATLRRYILGAGPLFPVPAHSLVIGPSALLGCVVVGLLAGGLSALLTLVVYAAEDAFARLPIHWMWWPAIGGLAVGLGGLVFPEALGVGYGMIGTLLRGEATWHVVAGILLIKSLIWTISLGSGTSGGVLAPLLMMGGAVGALAGGFLPDVGPGFWPLMAMGAILGGTMRSPFTGVVFAFELTQDAHSLLPLLLAVTTAYAFTVLTMKRSILTEKLSRRGQHLSREYALDPLELSFVHQVMRQDLDRLYLNDEPETLKSACDVLPEARLFPVADDAGRFVGVISRRQARLAGRGTSAGVREWHGAIERHPVIAYADETLRHVVQRMAQTGSTVLPVVDRQDHRQLLGMISLEEVLHARTRQVESESRRERLMALRRP
jgi:H+/Cl- antiporter ClcA